MTDFLHLDVAAAGRSSTATLEATAAHARLEAKVGCYVAEERASAELDGLRTDVAGLLGVEADGLAFTEGGAAARELLLDLWPLPEGAQIGILPSEWGPNLQSFGWRGYVPDLLAVDEHGVLDLVAFEARLHADPPAVVHLTQVAAHRGLVQPVREATALCREAGVPLWVDAAQALGHVDTAAGADAIYATGRKWLAGPRGVGMLGVRREHWDRLRVHRLEQFPDLSVLRCSESHEAHVAGRVGLAVAVREQLATPDIHGQLIEVGRLTREALADVKGWEVVSPAAPAGATTSLRSSDGLDPVAIRSRLLNEHRILTTACLPWRSPGELREPLLRLSPPPACDRADLDRFVRALGKLG